MLKISCFLVVTSLVSGTACAGDAADLTARAADAFSAGHYQQAAGYARQAQAADEEKFQAAVRQALGKKPFDTAVLDAGLAGLVEKTAEARRRAARFDEASVLEQLGTHPMNGFTYRFDDHFRDARLSDPGTAETADRGTSAGFDFNFDSSDTVRLAVRKGVTIVKNGVLKYRHLKGDYLASNGNLAIDKDRIGEILLRIKCKKGKRVKLAWSHDPDAAAGNKETTEAIDIDTIPDNLFHTYRINAKNVLRRRMSFGDRIHKIFLFPSAIYGDCVEIDFIRFVSKTEKYREAPAGVTYESIAQEMRRVIYIDSPRALSYDIDLPAEPCTLNFGAGILQADAPVTLTISIYPRTDAHVPAGQERTELYHARLGDPQSWTDASVDMSAWSGRKVTIQFAAAGATNNVAFISNPVLYTPPSKKMNIIIVLQDALRADHMSCYGHARATTPATDEWIRGGVQFLHAFSQATKTRPSCPTIMTSLYPTATGVWYFTEMLDDAYLTLAEILRAQGFETAAFIQNPNAGPIAGLHQGFSYLFDNLGEHAEELVGKPLFEWMDAHRDRNYFLYLHLRDPHGVYDPPRPFDQLYRSSASGGRPVKKDTRLFDPDWIENPTAESRNLLYDGEIQNNDHCFQALLGRLSADNIRNDTAIVVIADHGEHLGEHDLWSHRPPGYRQGLHVPLLMAYPAGLPGGLKISQPVQMIDVMPTILDLADIDHTQLILQGDSLLPLIRQENLSYWNSRVAFSEEVLFKRKDSRQEWCSLFFGDWHFLNSGSISDSLTARVPDTALYSSLFTTRIFDYVHDPQEESAARYDLADTVYLQTIKDRVRACQENNMQLHETLTRNKQREIQYEPEAIERLKGLGYIQ